MRSESPFSMSSKGTGSSEKKRTERRADMRVRKSREARNCSSLEKRRNASGICLKLFHFVLITLMAATP